MRRVAQLALLAAALGALALPGASVAATPPAQTSVTDIEDEVMCPICGTLLELADSPQARRERALIAGLVAEGKSKDEIKDELVVEYGDAVLAEPEGSGFELSAYLVPLIGFAVAGLALAIGVTRWRRRGGPGSSAPPRPDSADDERLDADIARYDL